MRSGISRTPDVVRMSEALSRPGIDPRIWAAEALVRAVHVDPEHGVLVDVTILPDGIEETARLAPIYAGSGWGLHLPVKVDDTVLVVAPHGNSDYGLEVVARRWEKADPPPASVAQYPDDVVLHVEPGRSLRVVVTGAGVVEFGGAGLTPMDGVVTGMGIDPFTGQTYYALQSASEVVRAKQRAT